MERDLSDCLTGFSAVWNRVTDRDMSAIAPQIEMSRHVETAYGSFCPLPDIGCKSCAVRFVPEI